MRDLRKTKQITCKKEIYVCDEEGVDEETEKNKEEMMGDGKGVLGRLYTKKLLGLRTRAS